MDAVSRNSIVGMAGAGGAELLFAPLLSQLEELLRGQIVQCCSPEELQGVVNSAWEVAGREGGVGAKVKELLREGRKDREGSVVAREEGNKQFQAGNFRESLACYNTAVLSAPWPGEEAAMALGNRAAVLGKMKRHKAVVEDLLVALDSGYPRHLHYKAWQRLAVAYEGLGRTREAREAYTRLMDVLDFSDIPTDRLTKMRKEARLAMETLELDNEKQDEEKLPLASPHPSMPTLSSKVEVREEEGRGRYLVARDTLDPGEVISKEEALAMSVDPSLAGGQCSHCLCHAPAPLPCTSCSSTVFCSRVCRDGGLTSHLSTCALLSTPLLATARGRSDETSTRLLLVLQLVALQPLPFHLSYLDSWLSRRPPPPEAAPYTRVLDLVQNLPHLDLPHHLSSVMLLLHLLRALSYTPTDISTEEEQRLCLLLCHVLAAVEPNIHATFQAGVRGDQLVQQYLGVSLFPVVASCFNHSCDPNTMVVDMGRHQVMLAPAA